MKLGRLSTSRRIVGRVLTVRLAAAGHAASRHLCSGAIEAGGAGPVIAVEHKSREDCAGWGGILSLAAKLRGIEGVIVEGACRDIDESREQISIFPCLHAALFLQRPAAELLRLQKIS